MTDENGKQGSEFPQVGGDIGLGAGGQADEQERSAPAPQSSAYQIRLPEIDPEDLTGELIVLEGPDGSGRSTQIQLLTEWLEWNGYAVQTMGLRRSRLLAQDIDELLGRNELQRRTLALLYATDFYDQLVSRIIPALRGGFVVLADRYIFTLVARAAVRGIDRDYLWNVYDFAVEPDLMFRLQVSPKTSFERLFEEQQAISYWEAGGDLNLSSNLYESFVEYQMMLRNEFDKQADQLEFHNVDGEQRVPAVNRALREELGEYLGIEDLSYEPSEQYLPIWNK